ncbi:hypothetical protein AaE_008050, partial [Aphanomyces astaci]
AELDVVSRRRISYLHEAAPGGGAVCTVRRPCRGHVGPPNFARLRVRWAKSVPQVALSAPSSVRVSMHKAQPIVRFGPDKAACRENVRGLRRQRPGPGCLRRGPAYDVEAFLNAFWDAPPPVVPAPKPTRSKPLPRVPVRLAYRRPKRRKRPKAHLNHPFHPVVDLSISDSDE